VSAVGLFGSAVHVAVAGNARVDGDAYNDVNVNVTTNYL
jgi:protein-disulfide isomerase